MSGTFVTIGIDIEICKRDSERLELLKQCGETSRDAYISGDIPLHRTTLQQERSIQKGKKNPNTISKVQRFKSSVNFAHLSRDLLSRVMRRLHLIHNLLRCSFLLLGMEEDG